LRDAEAAVVDVLVEHCGNLEVIAGVGKRASQQIADGVAEFRIVLPSEPARLASGWLVSLCRERVELSGSRPKVSDRSHVILLSRAYPVASWVHAERLVHQLIPATRGQAQAIETTRQLIWWFYRDLKVWKTDPCPRRPSALRARFDRIFTRRTGFVMLDRLLTRLHRRKAELLRVLERPEIPLHTSASENDATVWTSTPAVQQSRRSHPWSVPRPDHARKSAPLTLRAGPHVTSACSGRAAARRSSRCLSIKSGL
jgi:hypothetical protein